MTEQDRPGRGRRSEEDRGPRVVVGIDFSAGARAALLFALQDAARRGVPVEAVIAYRPPDYWMDFYAVGSYQPDQVRAGGARAGSAPSSPRSSPTGRSRRRRCACTPRWAPRPTS